MQRPSIGNKTSRLSLPWTLLKNASLWENCISLSFEIDVKYNCMNVCVFHTSCYVAQIRVPMSDTAHGYVSSVPSSYFVDFFLNFLAQNEMSNWLIHVRGSDTGSWGEMKSMSNVAFIWKGKGRMYCDAHSETLKSQLCLSTTIYTLI